MIVPPSVPRSEQTAGFHLVVFFGLGVGRLDFVGHVPRCPAWCPAMLFEGGCLVMAQVCSVEGCGAAHNARGMCGRHYQRWRRTGMVGLRECWADGCSRPLTRAGDYCPEHSGRPIQLCSVEGCVRVVMGRGYCAVHYQRWWRYGDPRFLLTQREDGTFEDEWTRAELLRRHGPECDTYQVAPSWYWRKAGFKPRRGSIPLAGRRHAYRLFCAHQVE